MQFGNGSTLSFTTAAQSTSASQDIQLTNTGAGALRIARMELTGPAAASFHATSANADDSVPNN